MVPTLASQGFVVNVAHTVVSLRLARREMLLWRTHRCPSGEPSNRSSGASDCQTAPVKDQRQSWEYTRDGVPIIGLYDHGVCVTVDDSRLK